MAHAPFSGRFTSRTCRSSSVGSATPFGTHSSTQTAVSSSRFLVFSFAIGYTSTMWLRASAGVSYDKGEHRLHRSSMSGSGSLAARVSVERGRCATYLAWSGYKTGAILCQCD